MALHVKTNLESTLVTKKTNPDLFQSGDVDDGDKGITLLGLQKMVGGFIQVVNLRKPIVLEGVRYTAMVMNEEGKLSGMRFNAVATKLAKLDNSIAVDDVIVGDVVLVEHQELN